MSKSVFISGANRGLGQCLVDEFLAKGWQVFAGRRAAARAGAVAAETCAELHWITLDVQDGASVDAAARAVAERTASLDVLINNAAVNPRAEYDAPLGQLDFAAIQLVYDVNAVGPLRMIQGFLPLLTRGTRKLIVNVSSEAGSLQHSWRDRAFGYCMSKAALNMQTTILDRALKDRGFNAIAVHPGWMRTEMGGADADLDPLDCAADMYQLIDRANRETPRFVQHDGTEFPW